MGRPRTRKQKVVSFECGVYHSSYLQLPIYLSVTIEYRIPVKGSLGGNLVYMAGCSCAS